MEAYTLNREMDEAIQEIAVLIHEAPKMQLVRYGGIWRQSDEAAFQELSEQTMKVTRLLALDENELETPSTAAYEAGMYGALLGVVLARTVRDDVQFTRDRIQRLYNQAAEVDERTREATLRYEDTLPESSRTTLRELHGKISGEHAHISYAVMLYSLYVFSDAVRIPRNLSQIVHDADDEEFDNILAAILES